MNSYAQIKGHPVKPSAAPALKSTAPADNLTDAEIARITKNRNFVRQHMPELVEFIRELHAEGMIDGWRSLQNCKLIERAS